MERGSRRSGRRTGRCQTSRIWITILLLHIGRSALLWHLRLRARVGWWESRRVRLIVGALLTGIALHWRLLRLLLLIHRRLLVALRRWRVLSGLLWRRRIRVSIAVLREGLAIGAVELRVRRRVLAAIDGVRGNECLSLGRNRSEDAFL